MEVNEFEQIAKARVESAKILRSAGLDELAREEVDSLHQMVDKLYKMRVVSNYDMHKAMLHIITRASVTVFPLENL